MFKQLIFRNKNFILAGIFCSFLVILRFLISMEYYYFFLIWNLFLAGIPFLISQIVTLRDRKAFYPMLAIWLLFLPNSFYVITDLIHLHTSSMILYDGIMISFFALLCLALGFQSMQRMTRILILKFPAINTWLLNCFILFLCAFGIYLGRFLRYNSWNIVSNPKNLLEDCLDFIRFPVQYSYVWLFTFFFGILLIGLFFIFQKLKPHKDVFK